MDGPNLAPKRDPRRISFRGAEQRPVWIDFYDPRFWPLLEKYEWGRGGHARKGVSALTPFLYLHASWPLFDI